MNTLNVINYDTKKVICENMGLRLIPLNYGIGTQKPVYRKVENSISKNSTEIDTLILKGKVFERNEEYRWSCPVAFLVEFTKEDVVKLKNLKTASTDFTRMTITIAEHIEEGVGNNFRFYCEDIFEK